MLRNILVRKVAARMSQSKTITEDWQYVSSIHEHLKQGELDKAFQSLIIVQNYACRAI